MILNIILISLIIACSYCCYWAMKANRQLKASQGIPSRRGMMEMDIKLKRELDKALSLDFDLVQEIIPQS